MAGGNEKAIKGMSRGGRKTAYLSTSDRAAANKRAIFDSINAAANAVIQTKAVTALFTGTILLTLKFQRGWITHRLCETIEQVSQSEKTVRSEPNALKSGPERFASYAREILARDDEFYGEIAMAIHFVGGDAECAAIRAKRTHKFDTPN